MPGKHKRRKLLRQGYHRDVVWRFFPREDLRRAILYLKSRTQTRVHVELPAGFEAQKQVNLEAGILTKQMCCQFGVTWSRSHWRAGELLGAINLGPKLPWDVREPIFEFTCWVVLHKTSRGLYMLTGLFSLVGDSYRINPLNRCMGGGTI